MKSAALCLLIVLISMLGFAQSSRAPLVNQSQGRIASAPHLPQRPRLGQGTPTKRLSLAAVPMNGVSQSFVLDFAPAVLYGSGGVSPGSVAVADVNGDGKPDIAVANQWDSAGNNGFVGVLLGKGDGTFQTSATYGPGGDPFSVAVADVNGDGKPDIVAANNNILSGAGSVGVLLGNGDGSFQTAATYRPGGYYPSSIAVADVNRDGKPDIVVANGWDNAGNSNGSVGVLLGNGDGTFQTAATYWPGGMEPYSVAVADVNGDGKPDIVVANILDNTGSEAGSVGVLLGNGDGTFQAAVTVNGLGVYASSVAVADVNEDGTADVVVRSYIATSSSSVKILRGNGDGTFQTAVAYGVGGSGYSPLSLAVADVNGDGKPDIVATDATTQVQGCVAVLINIGGEVALTVLPSALSFGNQFIGSTTSAQTVTVSSTGTLPLTISGISMTGPEAGDFAPTNNCSSSLAPGLSCTVTISFTPTATGTRTATLSIAHNASSDPQIVALSGTGESTSLGFSPGSNPTTATVSAGQTANYSLSIGGAGLSGTATLTCSGAPQGATCKVPASVTVDGTTVSGVNVSVSTSSRSAAASGDHWLPFNGIWATVLLGIIFVPVARRKRFAAALYLSLIAGLLLVIPSCGGSSSPWSSNSNGTPAGTYNLTVTATMSTSSQSVNLKLIVQ